MAICTGTRLRSIGLPSRRRATRRSNRGTPVLLPPNSRSVAHLPETFSVAAMRTRQTKIVRPPEATDGLSKLFRQRMLTRNQKAINGSVIMIRTGTPLTCAGNCGVIEAVLSTYTTTAAVELSSSAPRPTPSTAGRDIRS